MHQKLILISDQGKVKIRALAIKMTPANDFEKTQLYDAGFAADGSDVLLIELDSGRCTRDPFEWPSFGVHPRTMPIVHTLLVKEFDAFPDGQINVVDVDALFAADGEKTEPVEAGGKLTDGDAKELHKDPQLGDGETPPGDTTQDGD